MQTLEVEGDSAVRREAVEGVHRQRENVLETGIRFDETDKQAGARPSRAASLTLHNVHYRRYQ
jgi:hypothetical protein